MAARARLHVRDESILEGEDIADRKLVQVATGTSVDGDNLQPCKGEGEACGDLMGRAGVMLEESAWNMLRW